MARIKFSIFVLACSALGFAGLINLSGGSASLSQQQITERLAWGQVLFETSGHLAQAYRTAALTTAASDPALAQAATALDGAAPGAPAATAARKAIAAALETLPEALRGAPVVLVGNDKGVAMLAGEGEEPKLLDAAAFSLDVASRTAAGGYALVEGKLYRVAAVPLHAGGKVVGTLGAATALDDKFAAQEAKSLAMGVTLVAGKAVLSSLPAEQRSVAAEAQDGPVALGQFAALGPVGLPLFAGVTAPAQARTFALEGVKGGRVVITSEDTGLAHLADFQKRALLGLAALFALGLAFIALLGAPRAAEARAHAEPLAAQPEPPPAEPAAEAAAEPAPEQAAAQLESAEAVAAAMPEPAAPEAAPAELQPIAEPAPQPEPAAEAQLEPLPEPAPAPEFAPTQLTAPSPELLAGQEPAPEAPQPEALLQPEAAAPEPEPAPAPEPLPAEPAFAPAPAASPFGGGDPFAEKPFDPFAAAAAQQGYGEEEQREPERTVVAAVPEQLLRAAARVRSAASAPLITPVAVPLPAPAQPPPANAEEAHFQEIFKQFLATRAQCNEPSDGLTFDKFAAKLRKNKEQLVQKYACKSVRFQVYTKDGKAALKATPIKE